MADRPPDIEHAKQIARERIERAKRMTPIERIIESLRLYDMCQAMTPEETLEKRRALREQERANLPPDYRP